MKTKFFCALLCAMCIGLMGCSEKNAPEEQQSTDSTAGKNNSENGHEYVDLGLSVMWATCNVGASKPEEYGDYYAWGETSPKTTYDWSTYKYCNGSENSMTKYCAWYNYGTVVDNKMVLDPEDDAAHVNWGGKWRMPTDEEALELCRHCIWTRTTQNGVNGYQLIGRNGHSIFLPAAGYRSYSGLNSACSYGFYWSSSLYEGTYLAYLFYFGSDNVHWDYVSRCDGNSIRPVCPYEKKNVSEEQQSTDSTAGKNGSENGHGYVDLGLPSGIKWATCNVGASKPEEYGDYYAWGETSAKSEYNWDTYKYCNGSDDSFTKYCVDSTYGTVDYKTVLDLEDDVAHVNWGGSWRMPTTLEIDELKKNCTWKWTTQNGVNGYQLIGRNGHSIFLPAAGYRHNSEVIASCGYYWSAWLDTKNSDIAYYLSFHSDGVYWPIIGDRLYGRSVRPVCL